MYLIWKRGSCSILLMSYNFEFLFFIFATIKFLINIFVGRPNNTNDKENVFVQAFRCNFLNFIWHRCREKCLSSFFWWIQFFLDIHYIADKSYKNHINFKFYRILWSQGRLRRTPIGHSTLKKPYPYREVCQPHPK